MEINELQAGIKRLTTEALKVLPQNQSLNQ